MNNLKVVTYIRTVYVLTKRLTSPSIWQFEIINFDFFKYKT